MPTASGLTAFVVYAWRATPGVGWLDSSELTAGAHSLGVVHPPGHPLWCLLAKAFTWLPFGSVPFRVALFSAVAGGLSVAAAALLARRLAERGGASRGVCEAVALLGAVLAGSSAAFLSEASRPEVYALNAALVLGAAERALAFALGGGTHTLLAAAAAAGLGLANHHYLVLFAFPALLAAVVIRRDTGWRAVAAAMLVGALALVAYAALPIRAATQPVINWGDPTTTGRFLDVLMAKTFQASVSANTRGAPLFDNVLTALGMWGDSAGPITVALGLVAGVLWLRRAPKAAAVLLLLLAGNLATKVIMFIDPENPDDYGYFAVGIATCGVLAASLLVLLPRWAAAGTAALLLAGSAVGLPAGLEGSARGTDRSGAAFGDGLLEPLEPEAIAFVDYFQLYFQTWYAQLVEGARPDVTVVQASFDTRRGEGSMRRWQAQEPLLAPVLAAVKAAPERFPREEVLALARRAPVYLEVTLDDLVPPRRLESYGFLRRVVDAPLHETAARVRDSRVWRAVLAQRPGPDARRLVDFSHFNLAVLALRQGMPRLAADTLARWTQYGLTEPPAALVAFARAAAEPGRPGAVDIRAQFLAALGRPLEDASPQVFLDTIRTLRPAGE